ncbi:hypothetical protein NIES4103_37510 [Nostoc sp. NIES-4103]|nr:hypothetical protein NIES4103_37510 [Nostoc sp. NIES-4103]
MKGVYQSMELNKIYIYLNRYLFENKLEDDIVLVLSYKLKTEGLFLHDKWDGSEQKTYHEISIDENLLNENQEYWLAVLVHQMVHLWQYMHGRNKPPKHYHNEEFVNKMEGIGLKINSGYSNEQSINTDGEFQQVVQKLIDNEKELLLLKPRNAQVQLATSKNGKKFKYSCPDCNVSVWGKFGLSIDCGVCKKSMELQE